MTDLERIQQLESHIRLLQEELNRVQTLNVEANTELYINKDKAEKCDGTCQPYSMRPTYQVLEAQVKSLESYYEKYCILQEYNDEMTHENENLKEIVQKIRELALDVPMMITYEEFYKITKELGDKK